MVNPLYWVSALTYAAVLGMILFNDFRMHTIPGREERAFRKLLVWVVFFCLQDAVWGVCAGPAVMSSTALMISSTVFHASTVTTMSFWLHFVLTYLDKNGQSRRKLFAAFGAVQLLQAGLLIANFFTPVVFYVGADGTYQTAFLRPIAFMDQYIGYLAMGIAAAVSAFRTRKEMRKRYRMVILFVLAPILSGGFQLLYPDGPFYSLGYFLGCVVIHLFIILRDRDKIRELEYRQKQHESEQQMAEQIAISNTDELTRLPNRRAYEDALRKYGQIAPPQDFVYVSADVNELKVINDSLGHAAGDELLRGAAACLRGCLEPCGVLYRIGGDEFAAMISADRAALEQIRDDLNRTIFEWKGERIQQLSVSFGFAGMREFPGMSVPELAKVADERMYRAKTAYYMNKGIDRRGQQSAYAALCASYTKILRVNLTRDTYQIICMDSSEQTGSMGFSEKISQWLHGFGKSGQVHPDDLDEYLTKTDLQFLRAYFAEGKQHLSIFYKRRSGNTYRQVLMEMLPAEDYYDDQQSLYLYVKDIDK